MTEITNSNFLQALSWILSQLEQEKISNLNDKVRIEFELVNNIEFSKETQDRVLRFLENKKAISLEPYYAKGLYAPISDILKAQGLKPIGYYIEIIQPNFDNAVKEYKKQKVEISQNQPLFFLDIFSNRADFYDKGNNKIEFRNLVKPLILEILYKNKGKEVSTEKIRDFLIEKLPEGKNISEISKLINELRVSIQEKFRINPKDILPDGVSGSGYKIGGVVIQVTKK